MWFFELIPQLYLARVDVRKQVPAGFLFISAQNINKMWGLSTFDEKQKLQTLVFPEGITYSKENDLVRTHRVNALFALIEPLKWTLEDKKKGNPLKDCLNPCSVHRTGIELYP